MVNMINLDIVAFSLAYTTPNEESVEVQVGHVPQHSRSEHTYVILEAASSKLIDVTGIRVNDTNVVKRQDFLNKLINGMNLYDAKQNVKYWLNLHENRLTIDGVSQLCIVLTPVLVLCSYLPYELDARLNSNNSPCRIKSNAISYCSSGDLDVARIGLQFDRLSRASSLDEEDLVFEVSISNLTFSFLLFICINYLISIIYEEYSNVIINYVLLLNFICFYFFHKNCYFRNKKK